MGNGNHYFTGVCQKFWSQGRPSIVKPPVSRWLRAQNADFRSFRKGQTSHSDRNLEASDQNKPDVMRQNEEVVENPEPKRHSALYPYCLPGADSLPSERLLNSVHLLRGACQKIPVKKPRHFYRGRHSIGMISIIFSLSRQHVRKE